MRQHTIAVVALWFVAVAWGATFVVTQQVLDFVTVESFLFWRFLAAALVMGVPVLLRRELTRGTVGAGAILGVLLWAGYWFQTTGLLDTTPSRSAFITSLNVIFVPLFEPLVRKTAVSRNGLCGALLALSGMFFLVGGFEIRMTSGDILTLFSALAFAAYLVFAADLTRAHPSLAIASVQILTVCVISFPGVARHGSGRMTPFVVAVIAVTAIVTTALAFWILMWSQARLGATEAAIILALEPVAAAVTSVAWYGEAVTLSLVAGGLLILTGVVVSQWKQTQT